MKRRRIWTIRGHGDSTWYRTAIRLWKEYRMHIFWRGDEDPLPHDHPFDFWTFPLVGYWEQVYDRNTHEITTEYVSPWRWHFREAEYRHRVLGRHRSVSLDHGPDHYYGVFITLIVLGVDRRKWGFWEWDHQANQPRFIYWRNYIGKEG